MVRRLYRKVALERVNYRYHYKLTGLALLHEYL